MVEEYDAGDEVDLRGFTGTLSAYAAATTLAVVAGRAAGVRMPERFAPEDLVVGALATHKASRLIAKGAVASPIRSPFTRFSDPAGAAEHHEEARGDRGIRHTVGELLTCPFCLGVWIASAYVAGLIVTPRPTRAAGAVLTVIAGSDLLQQVYQRLRG